MRISMEPGVWIGVFCTLGIMSFLYKDNLWFKIVENAFVGFGAAHALVLGFQNIRDMAYTPIFSKGDLMPVVPVILGLALYLRFSKEYHWVARVPMGFLYGLGAAVAVRGTIGSEVLTQISATMVVPKSLDDVLMIVGVITVMAYFFFSFGQSNALKRTGSIGRWFMMATFGASFGATAMGRFSLLIDRLNFIYGTWLGLIR